MTDETVERVKRHYMDVLAEIIDDADTLHTTIPASKMTCAVMQEQQRQCSEQIKHLVTFLSQVYAQVNEIKIDDEEDITIGAPEEAHAVAMSLSDADIEQME